MRVQTKVYLIFGKNIYSFIYFKDILYSTGIINSFLNKTLLRQNIRVSIIFIKCNTNTEYYGC